MNRIEIENLSRAITEKYFRMQEEMSVTQCGAPSSYNDVRSFYYTRVTGLASRWINDEKPAWEIQTDLLTGLHTVKVPLSILFSGDGSKTGVYVGTTGESFDLLLGMLRGLYPQISYLENGEGNSEIFSFDEIAPDVRSGGFIKGNPTGNANWKTPFQIDAVIRSMTGRKWCMAVFCFPIDKKETLIRQQYWLAEASNCSELTNISISDSGNTVESVTYSKNYYHSIQYSDKVNAFCQKMTECVARGEWNVTINFSAASKNDAKMLGGLLTSVFYGEESEPEPVHVVMQPCGSFRYAADSGSMVHDAYCGAQYPKLSSYLSSRETGVFAAFPTLDTNGFSIRDYARFDLDRKTAGDLSLGQILDGDQPTGNEYTIDVDSLNRHGLVVGLTGSGKTNTLKNLLFNVSAGKKIPFAIIEPAKKEYWELYRLGIDDLQIYTVGGSEKEAHRLCINPFECVTVREGGTSKRVSIQTHIDFVFSAFKASFIMYTPMPYVLERAIYAIYEDCGWDIQKDVNVNGREIYPTIEDLYHKIPAVVTRMGYDQRMRNDLIGSLQARINSLRLGSKGETLNVLRSFPMDKILKGNVIIELEDIGDDDVKAFVMSVFLISLLEYRRQQEDAQQEVRHLLLIEEAHRLLKNVSSGTGENADPRGAAVEFFCNMLAELRSKGQGFVVADQVPTKLAPDLVKNTNLKIVHRMVAEEERTLMGGAMHMTPEQTEILSTFGQGVSAVYSEGDNRPILVRPGYAGAHVLRERRTMSRQEILRAVSVRCVLADDSGYYRSRTDFQPVDCRMCDKQCVKKYTDILSRIREKDRFYREIDSVIPDADEHVSSGALKEFMDDLIRRYVYPSEPEDQFCILNCVMERWGFSRSERQKLEKDYYAYVK